MPKPDDLLGQRLAQALEGPLRGVVAAQGGEGEDAAGAGDLDDVPAALLAQEWQHLADHAEGTQQVGVELGPDVLLVELLDRAEEAVAGIVHDDIDASEVFVGLGDGAGDHLACR